MLPVLLLLFGFLSYLICSGPIRRAVVTVSHFESGDTGEGSLIVTDNNGTVHAIRCLNMNGRLLNAQEQVTVKWRMSPLGPTDIWTDLRTDPSTVKNPFPLPLKTGKVLTTQVLAGTGIFFILLYIFSLLSK